MTKGLSIGILIACPAIAMFKQTTVDLTEPVGGRDVKDGTD
jgi:hypothetical protein